LKPGINTEKIARKIIASDVYRIYVQGELLIVKKSIGNDLDGRNRSKEAVQTHKSKQNRQQT